MENENGREKKSERVEFSQENCSGIALQLEETMTLIPCSYHIL
jgi:hypothetical protein